MPTFEERFRAARQTIIEQDLWRLNEMQRLAAMTTQGPLLVLAGAGSGKTTVLIQRVYNLLTYGRGSECKDVPDGATEDDLQFLEDFAQRFNPRSDAFIPPEAGDVERMRHLCVVDAPEPWEILAITFTNKAAGEIKTRLAERIGDTARDIWASTFHSACVRILRRNIERIGFERDFTIYDTDDSRRVMKETVRELNMDEKTFHPRNVLAEISRAKDMAMNPGEYSRAAQESSDWYRIRVAALYNLYQKKLRAANALDFDDLIFHTVTLLEQEPEVLKHYQRQFRYVLVDEYQDTNHIQSVLTGLLSDGWRNLCVVGDDDQSIYRFRGAEVEHILHFEEEYPDAKIIRLEENYRSTQHILDGANAVIANNRRRKGKNLWTERGMGERIYIRTLRDESEEAEFVAGDILDSAQEGRPFHDCAVLYRMNAQSNALEYAMKRNGIPYKIVGGIKFFDRAEIKDMLAYLCVLNNPMDDLRLRRIINTPARKIGMTTVDRVATLAESQGVSLFEIIRNADIFPELRTAKNKLIAFADMIDGLRKMGASLALPEFYDEVCRQSGYTAMLEASRETESKARLENVQELRSNIVTFLESGTQDRTLSGFLNEIALYTDLDSMDGAQDCVTMMTVHAAKGLEFPVVYVTGMEERIFPASNAMEDEDGLEEERRLCYVAMTRAKERLIMTNARQRLLYGFTSNNDPSRFLGEIRADSVTWKEKPHSFSRTAVSYGGYRAGESAGTVNSSGAKRPDNMRNTASNTVRKDTQTEPDAVPVTLQLAPGDRIEHDAFGTGEVKSVQPAGGDTLVTVEFETAGVKKLMLNYAGAYLKKL